MHTHSLEASRNTISICIVHDLCRFIFVTDLLFVAGGCAHVILVAENGQCPCQSAQTVRVGQHPRMVRAF